MTPLLTVTGLAVLLLLGAVAGPRLLGRTAPALSVHPRRGMALWASAAGVWVAGFLSLGPLLTWTLAGGDHLPGTVGDLCWRCVVAASPFSSPSPLATDLPAFPLLAVPVVAGGAVAAYAMARLVAHRRGLRRHMRALALVAEIRHVHGVRAWVVPSLQRTAYALPRRHDGIVLSQGTLDDLGGDELAAVMTHERAHLRGRHHLVLGTLRTLASVFGWVPLIAAAPAAVGSYAEMAADDAARHTCGTRALAGALLALHQPAGPAPAAALHAGHHEPLSRVERLTAAAATPPRRAGLATAGAYIVVMAAAALMVVTPYVTVAITGC